MADRCDKTHRGAPLSAVWPSGLRSTEVGSRGVRDLPIQQGCHGECGVGCGEFSSDVPAAGAGVELWPTLPERASGTSQVLLRWAGTAERADDPADVPGSSDPPPDQRFFRFFCRYGLSIRTWGTGTAPCCTCL